MSTQETFTMIRAAAMQALCVTDGDIAELQTFFRRRDSIGHIIDPTSYRNEMDMAERCKALFDAFRPFRAVALQQLAADLKELEKKASGPTRVMMVPGSSIVEGDPQ